MATYLLEGSGSAALPRRPLAVSLSIDGSPMSARLVARTEHSGVDAPGLRRHSADLLIVPRIEEPIVIAAVPDGGRERFDANTTLHVAISLDSGGGSDSDVAQLAPRDVSGLTSIELATLAPADIDRVLVTTRLIRPDAPLPALAARARVACRGVLGVDQLPPGEQRPLGCVIDLSASMAPLAAEGSVEAAVEIVAGIAAVVAGHSPVHTVLAGESPTTVPASAGAELPAGVQTAVETRGYGLGADLQAAVTALGEEVGLVIVVTDAPGPAVTGPGGVPIARLVLSGTRSAGEYPGLLGAVCPPPPLGQTAGDFLNDHPRLIDEVVAGLVAPLVGSVTR